MPQFDISSFVVQLIWLFFALIGLYLLLCLYFLPVTSQYIKARKSFDFVGKFYPYPLLATNKYTSTKISFFKKITF